MRFLSAILSWLLLPAVLLAQNETDKPEPKAPVAQYVVALLGVLLVMLIICMPSRKG